jgi:hypothetical protein
MPASLDIAIQICAADVYINIDLQTKIHYVLGTKFLLIACEYQSEKWRTFHTAMIVYILQKHAKQMLHIFLETVTLHNISWVSDNRPELRSKLTTSREQHVITDSNYLEYSVFRRPLKWLPSLDAIKEPNTHIDGERWSHKPTYFP